MATTTNQFGVTWTWLEDCTIGQFADGSWGVVAPSGITITSITPASTIEASRPNYPSGTVTNSTINGSMINPLSGTTASHGFDSDAAAYQADKNVARPGGNDLSAGNPLFVPAGSSLMSSISYTQANKLPAITDMAILTVVAAAPTGGFSAAFRPAYCGSDKTFRYIADLDYSILPSAPAPAGTPDLTTVANNFIRPWIEVNTEQLGRYLHPANHQPEYGSSMARLLGRGLLSLCLGYSNAQKETLYIRMVQYGLDVYGAAVAGGRWAANGGLNLGRKMPMLLAGYALNDASIKAYADKSLHFIFQEDMQTFVVDAAQLLVVPYTGDSRLRLPYKESVVTFPGGASIAWTANGFGNYHQPMRFTTTGTLPSPLAINTEYYIRNPTTNAFEVSATPYGSVIASFTGGSGTHTGTMVGTKEWGEKHSIDKTRDASNWDGAYYRDVNFHETIAHALAAHLISDGDPVTTWNWAPFFDYNDRVMVVNGSAGMETFFYNMWTLYRNNGGAGFPNAPTSLSAVATGNRLVTLTWVDNADNETYQLLERNSNGGAYATVENIGAGIETYVDHTVIAGKTHAYRLSAVNGTGASAYATASVVMPAANPNFMSRQNVLISSTT
jgi:hypothetical protein